VKSQSAESALKAWASGFMVHEIEKGWDEPVGTVGLFDKGRGEEKGLQTTRKLQKLKGIHDLEESARKGSAGGRHSLGKADHQPEYAWGKGGAGKEGGTTKKTTGKKEWSGGSPQRAEQASGESYVSKKDSGKEGGGFLKPIRGKVVGYVTSLGLTPLNDAVRGGGGETSQGKAEKKSRKGMKWMLLAHFNASHKGAERGGNRR